MQLCIEAELRFGSKIADLERKLVAVEKVFAEKEGTDGNLLVMMKHLRGNTPHSLITEMALPHGEIQVTAPHIYTSSSEIWIYTGSREQIIQLSSGNLQRALILCLLVYYLKNLTYPFAFSQMLILVQKIVVPEEPVPKGQVGNRLRTLLAQLKKKKLV